MVTPVRQEVGPVDILVNNAGMQHVFHIEYFPAEKWELLIALNFDGGCSAQQEKLTLGR